MTEITAEIHQDETMTDEARRSLSKVYGLLVGLAQRKTADKEDAARNQASKSADPNTTPAETGADKGAIS